jgi:acetyl-CoA acetyltransferase
VITLSENAKGMPKQPVHILGIGFGDQMGKLWWEQRNYTTMAVKTAKEDAFRQANVQLKDLDFAQLYDCFSGEVLFQLEDYGWCAKGKGGKFVSEGHIGPGGDIPVNTSGGLLSAYHFGDLTGLSEAILQIRGEADQRQLSKAEVGIATASGGDALHPVCQIHSCIVLGAQKTGS